jgi:hypothetical protein
VDGSLVATGSKRGINLGVRTAGERKTAGQLARVTGFDPAISALTGR